MIKFRFFIIVTVKYIAINIIFGGLAGCTTWIAHTSIDPYISDKQKRNQLELFAEQYCKKKRTLPGSIKPTVMPDYIFTTDGCSRWFDDNWVACCVVHDILYWCGGSDADRKEADQIIRQCADQKVPLMGDIMYPGVRVGGAPWWPTPWRWGYGWKEWPRGYEKTNNKAIRDVLYDLHIQEHVEEQVK